MLVACTCVGALLLTGADPSAPQAPPSAPAAAPAPASAPSGAAPPARSTSGASEVGIAAIWQQHTITWDRLRPSLAELAGSEALREALLDAALEDKARERAITVTEAMMQAEESTLKGYLDKDPVRADRLMTELRARQGLGPVRWRALLGRNAVLRALVARDVQVEESQVAAAHDAAHGPKRKVRVIAVPDLRAAQRVADRLGSGTSFEEVAAAESTDGSAARGGLIAPISRQDPGFPAAVREALWSIPAVGKLSPPVLVGTGYVLVRYDGDIAGDGVPLTAVRAEAERAVRLAQERARMDQLAQDLLRNIKPTIFDDSLSDGWNRASGLPGR